MPVGDESATGEMSAGRVASDIDALRIAADARGILVDPGNGAADLLHHRHQVAASVLHLHEIEHDKIRAGVHEHFRGKGEFLGLTVAPRAAVDVDIDRRVCTVGPINVELLVLGWTIGDALGSYAFEQRFAG